MCVYVYDRMCVGIYRGQKRLLDSLELETQAAVSCLMWVLGIEPGFSVKAASVLNFHTILCSLPSPWVFDIRIWG